MKHIVLAALLVFAPIALAQDEKPAEGTKTPMPMNPVAGAKEGDWCTFVWTMKAPGATQKVVETWRVTKTTDKEVTIQQAKGGDEQQNKNEAQLPAKDAPTIESFFQMHGDKVSDFKSEDDKKTVGGKTFACKKLTFKTDDGQTKLDAQIWISTDVKGSGLVALHITGSEGLTMDLEVAGFGSKDKVEFGKKTADIAKTVEGEESEKDEKKPEKK